MPTVSPMGYRDAAGKPRGFVIDALNAAAQRAGIELDWEVIGDTRANDQALRQGRIDLVAGTDSPERRREFFVSAPWWSSELVILYPAAVAIQTESDLRGRRVATPNGATAIVARAYPGAQLVPEPSAAAVAEAICRGSADAGVIAAIYLRELLFASSPACQGVQVRTLDSSARVDYVLTARPAVESAARALKSALDAITADGTLTSIAARNPPISAPHATRLEELLRIRYERRIWTIFFGAAAILIVAGIVFLVKQMRARRLLRAANARLETDLAARERAEAALRDSEARFRAIFDSAPEGVLAFDRSGDIVFANRRSLEMFGRATLAESRVETLLPERFRALLSGVHADPVATASRMASQADLAGLRADGTEFPIELRLGAVEAGEHLTLALISDIAERVALQQQLLRAQKLESVGQLAGGVAHDFNNLLTVISGYVEMILDETPADGELRESLSEIALAAQRAASLTRQLLLFSRRQHAAPKVLSLNEVLRNLEKMLRRLIGEDIDLTLVEGEIDPVRADPTQIEQVVVNLAVNARDAMPHGGKLTVETSRFHVDSAYGSGYSGLNAGEYVILRVSDTGSGMPPEVQALIFEPFFTTKEQGKGTGLGLSTVYGIVKQSGGEILVYSEVGTGTTFKILLPAAAGNIEDEVYAPPVAPAGGFETVLLAEDESGVRRFIKEVLSCNGYTVLEAVNGREALEIASKHSAPIHLLLSDVVMPELGGLDLAAEVRRLHPGIAVLYMSGYTGRSVGDPEVLIEKPFTPSALLLRVREALGARGAQSNAS